jgi:hypothetical protein
MIVSHKHRFVYFAPRRTGSSTITHLLQTKFDAKIFSFGTDYCRHEMLLPKEWSDYYAFVSVRNPYVRFASLFRFYYLEEGKSIDDILDISHLEYRVRPVADWLWGNTPEDCAPIRIDQVIRLENIREDFHSLPFVKQSVWLPVWNSKGGSGLYGRSLQNRVRKYYAKDFIYFGYNPSDTSTCEVRYL